MNITMSCLVKEQRPKKWFMEYTGIKNTQIDLRFKGETKTLNGGQTDKERAKTDVLR